MVLKALYRRLRGSRVWLYVDGASWHKGEEIRQFLLAHRSLRLAYLPPYQPALNPQERVWRRIRYEATTNRWFESLDLIWDTIQHTTHSWSPQKVERLCHIT